MPESEPKPKLIELVAPGAGQGWKAVLKSGKAAVVHEIPVPPAEATAAGPRMQRLFDHRHPALSPILAWGIDNNGLWVAVEPNEGTPLGSILTRGPLTPPAAAALGAAVLSGVAALHEAGIAMGGFGATAIRVTTNGDVRLAGHPAAAVRGAPSQSDLRADVRSSGMAVCAAFGVDPAGAPAPANIPPGLVVTMRSMASGAMGPSADRAQGALREMAAALLAPDRQMQAQSELATRAGGRELPPITPFLPDGTVSPRPSQPVPAVTTPEAPAPAPGPAPFIAPPRRDETPIRQSVSYEAPDRPVQTYPSMPAITFAPAAGAPAAPAAPAPPVEPAPAEPQTSTPAIPTWSDAPSEPPAGAVTSPEAPAQAEEVPPAEPGEPTPPAVETPPPIPSWSTSPPKAAPAEPSPVPSWSTSPPPAAPAEPPPIPSWSTSPPPPALAEPPPQTAPAEPPPIPSWSTSPPEAAPVEPGPAAAETPPPIPTWSTSPPEAAPVEPGPAAAESPPPIRTWSAALSSPNPVEAPSPAPERAGTQTTWTPMEQPVWKPGTTAPAEPLGTGEALPTYKAPVAEREPVEAPSRPVPIAPAPARKAPVSRPKAGDGAPSERPPWLVPAAIVVAIVLVLGIFGVIVLANRGGGPVSGNPSPSTKPTASPRTSPGTSPTGGGPQAVPVYAPSSAAPVSKVQICTPESPCNIPGSTPETATVCDLSSCKLEVAIYFTSSQKSVPVSYTLKFFNRCTGTTTDLPGAKTTTPASGYIVAVPTDHLTVRIPSGVKSGALVAVSQQPAVAASAPLLLGAETC
jgi:hypothetical protein